MKKIASLSLILVFLASACNVLSDRETEVEIRVKNTSEYTLNNLRINTGGGDYTYVTISPNSVSDYKTYGFSYDYFFISFDADTTQLALVPIDYVGEKKIKSGNYTYEISVETFEDRPINFSGELKKD